MAAKLQILKLDRPENSQDSKGIASHISRWIFIIGDTLYLIDCDPAVLPDGLLDEEGGESDEEEHEDVRHQEGATAVVVGLGTEYRSLRSIMEVTGDLTT